MEANENQSKIIESRYVIIIPLIITVVCAWLDIWTNISADVYKDAECRKVITDIIRCVMGYLFPSLLSIVIAMVWQQTSLKDAVYGVEPDRIAHSVILTVFYSTLFITCLIKYNIYTAILLLVSTIVYIRWFYAYCLDERIKPKNKYNMTEDELLGDFVIKEARKKRWRKR